MKGVRITFTGKIGGIMDTIEVNFRVMRGHLHLSYRVSSTITLRSLSRDSSGGTKWVD